jgi:hypothetical protein
MSATLCLVTPMSASSMLAFAAVAAWRYGMPRTVNEVPLEVKIAGDFGPFLPILYSFRIKNRRNQSSVGKGQGFGLQVNPFSFRNFVCCIITGASAPFFGQTT